MCLEKWKGIFWWNFLLQLLGRRHCHTPERNLFFELFGCLIYEKSHPQNRGAVLKPCLKTFVVTETQRNALNFWECMLDRIARESIDLNPLGHRMKLTQYSILYRFLMAHEISSKSVKISAQQMFMKVLKSLQFLRKNNFRVAWVRIERES